ncbi:MAG: glycosyltransferase family 2 protein, partial [Actinomycetota bacterium]
MQTLLVRDEADIVDTQIAYHLNAGVDFVIATDHDSRDGTTEILESYARDGCLRRIAVSGEMLDGPWRTHMARLAATEHDADWVINTDADEFWWPRGGSLKEVLATVPERYGVVRGCWRHFLPRPPGDADFFAERMTVRLCTPAHPGVKETIFHAHQKVAHRADPAVAIEPGNHDATGADLAPPLRGWHPLEVIHFSFRSVAQLQRKAVRDWRGWVR